MEECLSGGGGSSGGGHSSSSHSGGHDVRVHQVISRYQTLTCPKKTIKADMELALRLQAEFEGEGKSTSTSRALDPDEEFARKLQQEEERNRPSGVPCQLCTEVVGTDQLFILDV